MPGVERMRKVDLRIVTLHVPAQEAITGDNVTAKVNAELQQVIDIQTMFPLRLELLQGFFNRVPPNTATSPVNGNVPHTQAPV